MLLERDSAYNFTLQGNPFVQSGTVYNHYLLITNSTLEFVLGLRVTMGGFTLADALEMTTLWEVRQVDDESKQMVLRYSYQIDWKNKPALLVDLINSIVTTKLADAAAAKQV